MTKVLEIVKLLLMGIMWQDFQAPMATTHPRRLLVRMAILILEAAIDSLTLSIEKTLTFHVQMIGSGQVKKV
jgi:hypothetical protein